MKVVSTKLSKEEHDAMIETASSLGMNTAEYVRKCIMADLRAGRERAFPDENKPKMEQIIPRDQKKFCVSSPPKKPNELGLIVIHG